LLSSVSKQGNNQKNKQRAWYSKSSCVTLLFLELSKLPQINSITIKIPGSYSVSIFDRNINLKSPSPSPLCSTEILLIINFLYNLGFMWEGAVPTGPRCPKTENNCRKKIPNIIVNSGQCQCNQNIFRISITNTHWIAPKKISIKLPIEIVELLHYRI
jgi:hypothetical protein